MIVKMSKEGGKRSSFRSQGIRFESLMEERRMLLERGCQNKSHGLGIGTVKFGMKMMKKDLQAENTFLLNGKDVSCPQWTLLVSSKLIVLKPTATKVLQRELTPQSLTTRPGPLRISNLELTPQRFPTRPDPLRISNLELTPRWETYSHLPLGPLSGALSIR